MKPPSGDGGGAGGGSLLFDPPAVHRELFRDAVYTHDAWRQHRSSAWRHRPEPTRCLAVAAGFWVELAYVAGLATALGLYETLAVGRGGAPSVALARVCGAAPPPPPTPLNRILHACRETLLPFFFCCCCDTARALRQQEGRRRAEATAAAAPHTPALLLARAHAHAGGLQRALRHDHLRAVAAAGVQDQQQLRALVGGAHRVVRCLAAAVAAPHARMRAREREMGGGLLNHSTSNSSLKARPSSTKPRLPRPKQTTNNK